MNPKKCSANPILYFAFLRGVNVGRHLVKMPALKKELELLGLGEVKTYLASGNATFATPERGARPLTQRIEAALERAFGFAMPVVLRTRREIEEMIKANPFEGIAMTADTRFYITFLQEKSASRLKIPYVSADGSFRILARTAHEVFSVLTLSGDCGTVKLMGIIEKEFGEKVTTRNWNTIRKML